MSLRDVLDDIKAEMDGKDRRREELYIHSRELRRTSTRAIREMHKGDYTAANKYLKEAKNLLKRLTDNDKGQSFVQEALQEYAEAAVTIAFLNKREPPSPKELGLPSEAYALGLADAVGEIRRHILDSLRKGQFKDVDSFLDLMDEIFHGIMALDYPTALLPIRRKQDVARMLLEKTRGEVTLALRQAELEKRLKAKR